MHGLLVVPEPAQVDQGHILILRGAPVVVDIRTGDQRILVPVLLLVAAEQGLMIIIVIILPIQEHRLVPEVVILMRTQERPREVLSVREMIVLL